MLPSQIVSLDAQRQATVTCSRCGEKTSLKAPKTSRPRSRIAAKCSCGFHFLLDIIDKPNRNTPMKKSKQKYDQGFIVLLVDDEKDFRDLLSERLALRGIPAEVAAGGVEALDLIDANHHQVVLLDMNMPGMGGIEILRQIKNLSPSTQVILLSGQGCFQDAIKGMRLGAFDYLEKPLSLEKLIERIRDAAKLVPIEGLEAS